MSASLFDPFDQNTEINLFSEPSRSGNPIDVVQMEFLEAKSMLWQDLFKGFDRMYAITYSSGMKFICDLLETFQYAEVIFGFDDVMTYSLQEIMAHQLKTIERLRLTSSKTKIDLVAKIDDGSLKMFVARKKLSHEKIYLLESKDGKKRVIAGSANMSYSAFSGKQRENISYIDGDKAFDWYKNSFDELKEMSSDNISIPALTVADDSEKIDEIPIMKTIQIKKALVIEPDTDLKEDIRFVLDVKNLVNKFTPYMPKPDKKGKLILAPETVVQTKRRLIGAAVQEKELRSQYPQLFIDIPLAQVSLNKNILDLSPATAEIKNDVDLFLEYMAGYQRFHGDPEGMQYKYYAFANWFFTTPFMAIMRNMAVKYNQNLLPYPVFGLVYGQSKAGKTTFLETLLKMMIGQKTKVSAPDFTRSTIDGLKKNVQGAPIIVDDLTQTRFSQHAIETIKNDDFGVVDNITTYPAVVISANEDVKAVAAEVVRRTVICHVQAGLKNTELMKTSTVRRVQRNIGTAFYREYLRRMIGEIPELLDVLKNDEDQEAPDILELSSEILYEIILEHSSAVPKYVRKLTLDDYFSEKVTGSQAIKKIQTAWQINRKAFDINKKHGQLRFNAGQTWEADRIIKELPEDLEAHKSGEWIVMDLSKAGEFFGINFSRYGGILSIFMG
ncbi:phospholipase D family protein [Desulfosporosinus sp.]|uniref:phospholipase D family protein n=1 Tax=Desulfosporosinus sp. TaxID=157907 RepID=UPI00261F3CE4|nr:phospholipase D family protein [Desulfosporosinus sp.]